MKILLITATAVIAVYIGAGVALNGAADLAMRFWGQPVQAQSSIEPSNGQAMYPDYQLQPDGNSQQPANVVLEATPSHALQP